MIRSVRGGAHATHRGIVDERVGCQEQLLGGMNGLLGLVVLVAILWGFLALKRVDHALQIRLGLTRKDNEQVFGAGLVVKRDARFRRHGIGMPSFHVVAAVIHFGGREHWLPGAARSLADDVEIPRRIGFDAEADAVARMEDRIPGDFHRRVSVDFQDGVTQAERGAPDVGALAVAGAGHSGADVWTAVPPPEAVAGACGSGPGGLVSARAVSTGFGRALVLRDALSPAAGRRGGRGLDGRIEQLARRELFPGRILRGGGENLGRGKEKNKKAWGK